MTQYYIRENTPLAFHKFLRYVTFPIGFIISVAQTTEYLSEIEFFSWIYVIDLLYYFLHISLLVICEIGFAKWKSYGWYGINVFVSTQVCYCVYSIVIYSIYLPNEVSTAVGHLIAALMYAVPVAIYYRKRKTLFFQQAVGGKNILNHSDDLQPQRADEAKGKESIYIDNSIHSSDKQDNVVKRNPLQANHKKKVLVRKSSASKNNDNVLPQVKIQYCRKCGSKVNEDSIFCHKCGTQVIKE